MKAFKTIHTQVQEIALHLSEVEPRTIPHAHLPGTYQPQTLFVRYRRDWMIQGRWEETHIAITGPQIGREKYTICEQFASLSELPGEYRDALANYTPKEN